MPASNDGNIVKRTSQYIDNLGFDEGTEVPSNQIVGTDGTSTDGRLNVYRLKVNSDGSIDVNGASSSSGGKATDAYGWQATSDDGTYKYFYFEDASANYYIMRKHKTNKVATYTKGTGGYASVYVSSSAGPSGSPTWAAYGTTF
jgi:hypothetical protein